MTTIHEFKGEPGDIDAVILAIGKLAIAFSTLELNLHVLTWELIAAGEPGMAPRITENMSANAVAELLLRLAPFSQHEERVANLVKDFKDVSRTRNNALHSIPESDEMFSVRERLKSVVRHVVGDTPKLPITVEEADAALTQCRDIQARATELIFEISPTARPE